MTERQGTPFPFQGPVPPALLIDREIELTELMRRAADRVHVRMVAPRRFGKTSVLHALAAQLRQTGWRAVYVDLSRVTDITDVARRFAQAYAELDQSWVRAHLSGVLSRVGVSMTAAGPGVTVGPRPSKPDGVAAESVLLPLLDLPMALWETDQLPTLVVFDEFQDLLVAHKDLDGVLRSRIQHHADAAAYVFAGSEPSMMRELFDTKERPLFGQAIPLTLTPLPLDVVIAELTRRFVSEDLDPGTALGPLVVFAAGHPQRTMLLAYLLADRVSSGDEPTAAVADEIIDEAIQITDPAHQAVWQTFSAIERVAFAAVADGVAVSSQQLADQHSVARSSLNDAADRLAAQGHLSRAARTTTPVDPLLAEWVRRR
ncbi:AAA-like domain-containing protein [Solirubrobacter phytolaccae]|uniref:AAA-like domain-containing protein n=1 Tax=Solirubrobacter phytolaccae TaxID=1404360 RepID=A0A9X3NFN6_9ACTN|nr:hypothetical protein [Solirubrobacter phytolaccae]MDA0185743.1 AAA-like domain-containing protein [Solirubrobacter phytolaccae]